MRAPEWYAPKEMGIVPYGTKLETSELVKRITAPGTDIYARRGYLHALAEHASRSEVALRFLCDFAIVRDGLGEEARKLVNLKLMPDFARALELKYGVGYEFLSEKRKWLYPLSIILVDYCAKLEILSGSEEKNVHAFLARRLSWTCGHETKILLSVHGLIKGKERLEEFESLIPALVNTWHMEPLIRLGLFRTIPDLSAQFKSKQVKLVWGGWRKLPLSHAFTPTDEEKVVLVFARNEPEYMRDVEKIRVVCGRELVRNHNHKLAITISGLLDQLAFYLEEHS